MPTNVFISRPRMETRGSVYDRQMSENTDTNRQHNTRYCLRLLFLFLEAGGEKHMIAVSNNVIHAELMENTSGSGSLTLLQVH